MNGIYRVSDVNVMSPSPDPTRNCDKSNGWEANADELVSGRGNTRVGAGTIAAWLQTLAPGAAVLDLGCGSGVPVSELLLEAGFNVYGIDASPSLVTAFRRQFPAAEVACEAVEESTFFNRRFSAVVAIGLMFLLTPEVQYRLIHKVGRVLEPSGQFLFTAPCRICKWEDASTGRESISLGAEAYTAILAQAGLAIVGTYTDEGENHYFAAVKNQSTS